MNYTFKNYSDISSMLITELDSIVEFCVKPSPFCRYCDVQALGNQALRKFKITFRRANDTEKVPEKITKNQLTILKSVEQNQRVTIPELSAIVKISERKIRENISKLKSKGLIERVGADKGGYWRVKA